MLRVNIKLTFLNDVVTKMFALQSLPTWAIHHQAAINMALFGIITVVVIGAAKSPKAV